MIEPNFRVDKLANLNGYDIQKVRETMIDNPMRQKNDTVGKEKRREEVQRERYRDHIKMKMVHVQPITVYWLYSLFSNYRNKR